MIPTLEVDVADLCPGRLSTMLLTLPEVGMAMIRNGLAQAVLFDRNGKQVAPSNVAPQALE